MHPAVNHCCHLCSQTEANIILSHHCDALCQVVEALMDGRAAVVAWKLVSRVHCCPVAHMEHLSRLVQVTIACLCFPVPNAPQSLGHRSDTPDQVRPQRSRKHRLAAYRLVVSYCFSLRAQSVGKESPDVCASNTMAR